MAYLFNLVLGFGAVFMTHITRQEAMKVTTFCLTDISNEHHICQDSSRYIQSADTHWDEVKSENAWSVGRGIW